MASAGTRILIIYLCIGLVLTFCGQQASSDVQNPITTLISSDVINTNTVVNGTGLNSNFQNKITPSSNPASSVFGFIDTLASVFNFIIYMISNVVLSPITLFTSYGIPQPYYTIFGLLFLIGLILWIVGMARGTGS